MADFKINDLGDGWKELCFDQEKNAAANVFTKEALEELDKVLDDLATQSDIKGLLITSAKEKIFIAGADIELIKSLDSYEKALDACRSGQQIIHKVSKLPFETVAAINGACLGGGFEMALACTKIIASESKAVKIGLPEVNLGILPGFGGSVRLPRFVSLPVALDMILTGKQVDGKKAYKSKITAHTLPELDFRERAIAWAKANHGKARSKRKIGLMDRLFQTSFGRAYVLSMARKNVLKKTKGHYPAPLKILDLLGKTLGKSLESALVLEAQFFASLAVTSVSKRLIELFQLSESVKKTNGVDEDVRIGKVRKAAVLGAGVMGGGIAHAFAKKDIPIRMKDINTDGLALGYNQASKIFNFSLKRRRMKPFEFTNKMAMISGTTDFTGFKDVDVIVEAVVENMDVKKKVIQEAEANVGDHCIIASNTSSLSISEMQSVAKRPDKIGGLHFFNPVNRMPLVEVIVGDKTSKETTASLFELSKKLGKTPIVVKDGPGFLVNRLLLPYMNEAVFLLEEGVQVERIDRVMLQFGMPMGPIRLIDEVGIDVGAKVAKILYNAFGERAQCSELTEKIAQSGRLGKKNSKGFYKWVNGKAVEPDESIYEHIQTSGRSAALSDQALINRMIFPMINEAVLALREGIVGSPGELDLAMIMGTGFPPFRGGLLRYADTAGVSSVYKGLDKISQDAGVKRLEPNEALKETVERGQFYA